MSRERLLSRNESIRNRISISSTNTNDTSLYPGEEHPFMSSVQSRGSLWKQYSLIHQEYELNNKPLDVCFCCVSDSFRHWTLKSLFLLVVGLGLISSCLALRFSVYAPRRVFISGGDQALLPISTYFNKRIKIKEHCDHGFDESSKLIVLPNIPDISPDRLVYHEGTTFLMPSWSYQYWGLNLLKGTEVTISICADLHLQFYILKGEQKLKNWEQTTLFNDYDLQSNIRPQKSCDDKKYMQSHLLKIYKSDVYYIMFSSSVGWRFFTEVTLALHYNRTVYDTANYRSLCLLSDKSCSGQLRYGSEDIVLIETAINMTRPRSSFKTFEITYDLIPRWSFYFKLFGYIYLTVVSATFLYTIWRFCVVVRKKSTPREKEPLLRNLRHYSYSMRSAESEKEPWLVVNQEGDRGDESLDVQERDAQSVFEESIGRHPSYHRHHTTESNYSDESEYSLYVSTGRQRGDMIRDMQLMEQQQLLDSVMTSAGVSAI